MAHVIPLKMSSEGADTSFSDALVRAERWVGRVPGVVRVSSGLYETAPCITVFVCSGHARLLLPRRLGGWRVVLQGAAGGEY
jgi:hypothetical protein